MQLPLTERAKRVLKLAEAAARQLGHDFIGTEHVLLGILREGGGVGIEALKQLRVDPAALLVEIEENLASGSNIQQKGDIPFTPRARAVIEIAEREARGMNQNYVGSEHILLGLVGEGEGVAAQHLLSHEIDAEKLKEAILEILGAPPGFGQMPSSPAAQSQKRSKSKTPATDNFSRDLTVLAKEGKLDPVIGRKSEIQRVIQILARRTKNNPVLIGDPGVGKTAIVEGLAQLVVAGSVPEVLREKRVMTLDLGGIVAGTKYRGEFEDRLKRIVKEITSVGNVILFIDEIHLLVGAGAAEGSLDAANILKPQLARGEIQCIGATTLDEYRKYVEKDAALERRFQTIMVEEPSVEDCIAILRGLKERYEDHHRVRYSDEAVEECAQAGARYISDRFLPDKAIDLLDEAGSVLKLRVADSDPEVKKLEARIEELAAEKAAAAAREEFEKCATLKSEEEKLGEELKQRLENRSEDERVLVDRDAVLDVVASWTGIAMARLKEDESSRLLRMEDEIGRRFIGQREAVEAIAKSIRRGRTGIKDPKRPTGSFLFLGPTGVGKTELARALAEFLFNKEEALVRIDMSEFREPHSVARLIGAPPGYVGHEEGGVLTEAVRRHPWSVVLFDEIEKAHHEVFHTLLQVLDDGRLTDSLGHTVDFRNTVIILTSNIGTRELNKGQGLGFSGGIGSDSYDHLRDRVMDEVKRLFSPEFLNRLDDVVIFHSLSRDEIGAIASLMAGKLAERLSKERGMNLCVDDAAISLIADKGFDPAMGARPLRRTIQRLIEDRLADEILRRGKVPGILVTAEGGEIVFKELNRESTPATR